MIDHSAKKPKRGEIWVVNLEPTLGKEIKKTRPCLVMQSDLINEVLRTTMVAPITSTVKENWPFAIILEKGEGGLKNKSMALFNQIKTTDIIRFIKRLGIISNDKMKQAEDALSLSFQIKR